MSVNIINQTKTSIELNDVYIEIRSNEIHVFVGLKCVFFFFCTCALSNYILYSYFLIHASGDCYRVVLIRPQSVVRIPACDSNIVFSTGFNRYDDAAAERGKNRSLLQDDANAPLFLYTITIVQVECKSIRVCVRVNAGRKSFQKNANEIPKP